MTDDEGVDLSCEFDEPMDLPCCPLCDNAILVQEAALVFRAHGCLLLGHAHCIGDIRRIIGI